MNDDPSFHKKSLREILPKAGGRVARRQPTSMMTSNTNEEIAPENSFPADRDPILAKRRRPRMPKFLVWGIGLIILIIAIFGLSSFFSQVTIFAVPKQAQVNINETITASLSAAENELEFGTFTKTQTASVAVPATGSEQVSRKASGQITIFNDFSDEPQLLIATTRFETADAKIYRIKDAVTVPGQKIENGQTVPGSITTTVVADQPGESYNIPAATFTIPGFEGSARYDKFSAKSQSAMAGGFVGTVRSVAAADQTRAETELRTKLNVDNPNPGNLEIPSGHILFNDALFASFDSVGKPETTGEEVEVVGTLTFTGILFDKNELAGYLATKHVPDYSGESVEITNVKNLTFTLKDKADINPATIQSIDFDLEGSALMRWQVDEEALKRSLAGFTKSNFQLAIGDFPSIESVKLKFMPPWNRTIPEDTDKIKVTLIDNQVQD